MSVPKSWAEFEANNEKIKAAGIAPVIASYGAVSQSSLTTRELGIVRLVAKGLTDQQVGNQLGLSRHTVGKPHAAHR
ncbi:MAG: hypothetical protein E6I52_05195 [Chloroflexi bacterium]|nr:MAG: hypothetical protein E6I52_05195 [Chloroflexota bacterium]